MSNAEPVGARTAPTDGQTKIVNVNDMPWQKAKTPGIEFKVLYRDEVSGAQTLLLKFAPGAKTPLHEHTGLEQTFVIEGGLVDHDGAVTAGNFAWRQAGSVHQATAPGGSLHISFFTRPNRMLDGSEDDLVPQDKAAE
jgi:anti-sigma factor ChrR (cupin superfamily)